MHQGTIQGDYILIQMVQNNHIPNLKTTIK